MSWPLFFYSIALRYLVRKAWRRTLAKAIASENACDLLLQ